MDSKPNLWEIEDLRGYFKDKHLDKRLEEIIDYLSREYEMEDFVMTTLHDIQQDIETLRHERENLKQELSRYEKFKVFNTSELEHLNNFGRARIHGLYSPGRPSTVSRVMRRIKDGWRFILLHPKFSKNWFLEIEREFPQSTIYKALKNLVS